MLDEIAARRAACTDSFLGNGLAKTADLIASIGTEVEADTYGDGGVVADLEKDVAELLGKPAAVYLPSGTMAQQAALRVHADARTSRTVLWHPYCHLARHELDAYAHLHGLVGRSVGDQSRLITLADLESVAEPAAALLLELPQRDLGGQMPSLDDLFAQVSWARERGAAVHLDGARLWEAAVGYHRSPAEIAQFFDTVYVSFYKGVGALPGCCVAGPEEVIRQVREWRRRLGGTLHGLWPGAASARNKLSGTLAEMPARMEHALAIAKAVADVPGVRAVPAVPQSPMMHLLLTVKADRYAENAKQLAEADGFWVWPTAMSTEDPDVVRVELSVGSATLRHDPLVVANILARLIA